MLTEGTIASIQRVGCICNLWRGFSRFRWVVLQLEELPYCISRHEVEEHLQHLPQDLNESYDQMLDRIEERHRDDVQKVFRWLAFALRPLQLTELAEVIGVDFHSRDMPWFDFNRRYYNSRDVIKVCLGFVVVTEGNVVMIF